MLSPYGIWVGEFADARSLDGEEPNVIVHRGDGVTGSDAISIAEWRWPGAHVVRELKFVAAKWIAVQASE